MPPQPQIEREDHVFSVPDSVSGAGPMWCFGNTLIVREGDDVFISGVERVPDANPLNTWRWVLYQCTESSWQVRQKDEAYLQREPCPIALLDGGRLMMSVNPSLAPEQERGPARPEVLEFAVNQPDKLARTLHPGWNGSPPFCEHSYRSFVVDRQQGEILLIQNIGYAHAEWSLCDATGQWSHCGRIAWPWGAEYDRPQPIRICYPSVALVDRKAYVFGTSDILEPYSAWADYRAELGLPREYDFRRVFFTWTDDITSQPFRPWKELGTRDRTAGKLRVTDLHVDANGRAHLLWTERAIDEQLRERFFPDARQWYALNYAVIDSDGRTDHRHLFYSAGESPRREATFARFHVARDGHLLVLYAIDAEDDTSGNYLAEVAGDMSVGEPVRLPCKTPLHLFMTPTLRAGNERSDVIDMMGTRLEKPLEVRYIRVRV